jgi:hypothetical protein
MHPAPETAEAVLRSVWTSLKTMSIEGIGTQSGIDSQVKKRGITKLLMK